MKKKVIVAIVTAFVMFGAVLMYLFVKAYQEKKGALEKIKSFPTFSLQDVHGNTFTAQHLNSENWTVFVFFNSECHYCQSEAAQLQKLKTDVANINFIWISSETPKIINAFQKEYGLESLFFLYDTQDHLTQEWGITTTPQFLIYTPQGVLFKNHKGALRIDYLIREIHEHQKD